MRRIQTYSAFAEKYSFLAVTTVAIILFTFIGYRNLDPDFGWHFQLGKIIISSGIPETDPFTFTMSSYPFVDYEWGSNVLMYEIYSRYGKLLLSIVFAFCAVLSVRILIPKKTLTSLFLYSLCLSTLVQFVGTRPQVLAWVFVAILTRLLFYEKVWGRWRWGFPLLMLLWANIHGSYPLAFVIFGTYKFGELIQFKRIVWSDVNVFILGLGATLLNPYGVNNWFEVIKQMSQTSLFRKTIVEWQPVYTNFHPSYWFVLALFVFLAWRYKTKIKWSWVITPLLVGLMAFTSGRHVPIFAITVTPLLLLCFMYLNKEASGVPFGLTRYSKLINILTIIATTVLITASVFAIKMARTEERTYPIQALRFIKNNIHGPMFNDYNWGGYLIWKVPDRKVFIDGRTSGFNWNGPVTESNFIYKDYLQISAGKGDWVDILDKFNIKYALLRSQDLLNQPKNIDKSSLSRSFTKWFVGWGDDSYFGDVPLAISLQNLGWEIVYQDEVAVVFEKP